MFIDLVLQLSFENRFLALPFSFTVNVPPPFLTSGLLFFPSLLCTELNQKKMNAIFKCYYSFEEKLPFKMFA